MKGTRISLEPLGDQDYDILAGWMTERAGVYSSAGTNGFRTGAQVRAQIEQSGVDYLLIVTNEGQKVGAVSWAGATYPGSYTVGLIVGDETLWNYGYGMEAGALLLTFLFHIRNAHRVQVQFVDYNRAMMQLVTSGIFVLEGVLRDHMYFEGRYRDVITCAILREEFYALATSGLFDPIEDVISAQEQDQARQLLLKHLAAVGDSYLAALVERPRREAP